jgi:hypothetical protein
MTSVNGLTTAAGHWCVRACRLPTTTFLSPTVNRTTAPQPASHSAIRTPKPWAVGPTAHSRSRGRLAPLPEAKG